MYSTWRQESGKRNSRTKNWRAI